MSYICIVDEDEVRFKCDDLGETVAGQCYFHSNLTTHHSHCENHTAHSATPNSWSKCSHQGLVLSSVYRCICLCNNYPNITFVNASFHFKSAAVDVVSSQFEVSAFILCSITKCLQIFFNRHTSTIWFNPLLAAFGTHVHGHKPTVNLRPMFLTTSVFCITN